MKRFPGFGAERSPHEAASTHVSQQEADVEALLRSAAPALPPSLRSATLMRCAAEREALHRKRHRGQWRWAWTIAGLCALQWGAMSYFDAKNAALIEGKPEPSLLMAFSMPSLPKNTTSLRCVLAARAQFALAFTREKRDSPKTQDRNSHEAG